MRLGLLLYGLDPCFVLSSHGGERGAFGPKYCDFGPSVPSWGDGISFSGCSSGFLADERNEPLQTMLGRIWSSPVWATGPPQVSSFRSEPVELHKRNVPRMLAVNFYILFGGWVGIRDLMKQQSSCARAVQARLSPFMSCSSASKPFN